MRAEAVVHRGGDPLSEETLALEGQEVLLDQTTHDVLGLREACLAKSSPKPIGIEQRQKEEEVLVAAVVGRCGEQQQIARPIPDELAELEAKRPLHLVVGVEASRHLVSFVDDD